MAAMLGISDMSAGPMDVDDVETFELSDAQKIGLRRIKRDAQGGLSLICFEPVV